MSDAPVAGQSSTNKPSPGYNSHYEELVDIESDEFDLEGMLAYALYKEHKRDFILKFIDREARKPKPVDLKYFQNPIEGECRRYKSEAKELLEAFGKVYFQVQKDEVVKSVGNKTLNEVKGELSKHEEKTRELVRKKTGFFRTAFSSTLGAVFYTIAIAVVLFVAASRDIDVSKVLLDVIEVKTNGNGADEGAPTQEPREPVPEPLVK